MKAKYISPDFEIVKLDINENLLTASEEIDKNPDLDLDLEDDNQNN